MKTNNDESLSRRFLNRVLAPEGELLSFAPPKESSQRKGGPVTAHVLRSSYLSGDGKRGFLPLCRRAASLPHPFGLFPTNTPVLDAVNGTTLRYYVTQLLNRINHQNALFRLCLALWQIRLFSHQAINPLETFG